MSKTISDTFAPRARVPLSMDAIDDQCEPRRRYHGTRCTHVSRAGAPSRRTMSVHVVQGLPVREPTMEGSSCRLLSPTATHLFLTSHLVFAASLTIATKEHAFPAVAEADLAHGDAVVVVADILGAADVVVVDGVAIPFDPPTEHRPGRPARKGGGSEHGRAAAGSVLMAVEAAPGLAAAAATRASEAAPETTRDDQKQTLQRPRPPTR